ncbi:diguanylate cyclase (GGDEF) domain-containing protein [Paenibacillus algorifonticola]|uniref:Diguanylate cyclase (GGDEF) domain-containing protein n=1 Tax=Paenibacillus algorifonticola TaxID=684063 RepID=A0A1I2G7J7_9BACL|nr:GGDEF domain-containing protein [Paenibacillus algorifonticola]SFF13694.1 diguanylate cyclase (GGDEF) domain-containing protein [Paenibacillus algorifonticola]
MFSLSSAPRHDSSSWYRIILNVYWVLCILALTCQYTIFAFQNTSPDDTFFSNRLFTYDILVQNIFVLVVMVSLEVIIRYASRFIEKALITGAHLITMSFLFFLNTQLLTAPALLLLPMLITILFLRPYYLFVSLLVSMLYLFYIYFSNYYDEEFTTLDAFFFAGILIATAMVGFAIIHRARGLLVTLNRTLKSEQELLIKNIVMDRMSKIDPLTDLYNHKTFHEYVEKLIEYQEANPFNFQLAIIDIDNFKHVNDTYGHWVGDITLKQMAATLLKHLKTDDFAARYGGEEFILILHEESLEKALALVEEIRVSISQTKITEMDNLAVTVSIGLHEHLPGESKEDSFQEADQALYESKNSGKNKTTIR